MEARANVAHRAVVIGINHYDHGVPRLRTARNDAAELAQLLQDQHGYIPELLLDQDASKERIRTLLADELPQQTGPDDRVLFYFAGHGVARDGEDGPNGYLLPQDADPKDLETFLEMPWLHDTLNSLKCRHMLVILDSCFGGAFRWSATRNVIVPPPKVLHQERYDRFILDPAWQVITSASHDQTALDVLKSDRFGERGEQDGHSPFALALFEALVGKEEAGSEEQQALLAALRSDGVITATERWSPRARSNAACIRTGAGGATPTASPSYRIDIWMMDGSWERARPTRCSMQPQPARPGGDENLAPGSCIPVQKAIRKPLNVAVELTRPADISRAFLDVAVELTRAADISCAFLNVAVELTRAADISRAFLDVAVELTRAADISRAFISHGSTSLELK